MNTDTQVAIGAWIAVTVVVFLAASLLLDDEALSQREKIWIGRIGLAAPLWPLMMVAAIVGFFLFMARELMRAARGRR